MLFKNKKLGSRLKIVSIFSLVLTLVVNFLANVLPINGNTTAEVSEAYTNLFTPAGWTFSIWGVIYTLLIIYSVYQFIHSDNKKTSIKSSTFERIAPYFIGANLLNATWLLAWHFRLVGFSVLIMAGLLASLVLINEILRKERYDLKSYIAVRLPFAIYFGWITVATIANVTAWLVSVKWDGFGVREGVWTVGVLLIGAVIGLVTAFRNIDWAYLAVFVWAYTGILFRHLSGSDLNGSYPSTITTLTILLSVFMVFVITIAQQAPLGLKK